MKNLIFLLSTSTGLFLASCGSNGTGTSKEDSASTASANATTYNLDLTTSEVNWIGTKLFGMGNHIGTIAIQSGSISIENNTLVAGNIVIDMKTIKPGGMDDPKLATKLVGHLSSEDFFNVESFPTSKFEISKVEIKSEGENTHIITGNLQLRDTSLSISFPAKVVIEANKITAHGKVVIDRFKWGVNYDSEKHKGNLAESAVKATKGGVVSNEIEIEIHLVANK